MSLARQQAGGGIESHPACAWQIDFGPSVQVREVRNDRNALVLELHVAPNDYGKVIGRQGRVAKAMRALLRAGLR